MAGSWAWRSLSSARAQHLLTPCAFQVAELIPTPPCLMTLNSAEDEPKQQAPKQAKAQPWAPPPQHNFLKNWQRNITLRKRQQEALSSEQSRQASRLASPGTKALLLSFLSLLLLIAWIVVNHVCAVFPQVLPVLSGS